MGKTATLLGGGHGDGKRWPIPHLELVDRNSKLAEPHSRKRRRRQ